MKKSLIAAALIAASLSATAGQFFSGNNLLERLKSEGGTYTLAVGYVIGIADANEGVSSCTPDTIVSGQLSDLIKKFLIASPEVRHLPASYIVSYVLKQSWPCAAPAAKPTKSSSI